MDNYFGKLQKCDAAWLAIYKVDVEIDISVDYGAGEFRFTIAFSIKKCFMIKKNVTLVVHIKCGIIQWL